MNIVFYDTHEFEKSGFQTNAAFFHYDIKFLNCRLTKESASMASGFPCVCVFVNDTLDASVLKILAQNGTRLIALRSAGFNHVDIQAAKSVGLKVVRVPGYSPFAVAEHAIAMILSLNRKIHRAYNRVREGNFSLNGLVGFDLHGKTIGILGTGKIGTVMCNILTGFGCHILAFDIQENLTLKDTGVRYVPLEELLRSSDIISLHLPLNTATRHLINGERLKLTKPGVMLINTGRGGLIDTHALITFLKSKHIGSAGLDVYEEEEGVFFQDFSETILQDDQLARLLTFPNVLMTSHQAFLTEEALENIATTTLQNISAFEQGRTLVNEVH